MKQKYPAEAFALGIVLFSAGMREAFAAGILVILTVVFAEFLKNLLEKCSLPDWSFRLCVYIAAGAVGASAFLLGFAGLGILLDRGQWLMAFVVGLLCAHQALRGCVEADYGALLWESAIVWGFVVLFLLIAIIKAVAYLQNLPAKIAAKKSGAVTVTEPVKEIPAPAVAADTDEDEVVAAITAAIAAYYGAEAVETSDLPFRVRSIREIK